DRAARAARGRSRTHGVPPCVRACPRAAGHAAVRDRADRRRHGRRSHRATLRSVSRVAVVIPAGGAGRRMGGVAKPFLELCGVPLLRRTLEPFLARPDVHWIVIALPADLAASPPSWLSDDARIRIVA